MISAYFVAGKVSDRTQRKFNLVGAIDDQSGKLHATNCQRVVYQSFGLTCSDVESVEVLARYAEQGSSVLVQHFESVCQTEAKEFQSIFRVAVVYLFMDFPVFGTQRNQVGH